MSIISICIVFLYELVEFLLHHALDEGGVPSGVLFSSVHHILCLNLIWTTSVMHPLSLISVYMALAEHFLNFSDIFDLLLPTSSLPQLWLQYELSNVICFVVTVLGYFKWPEPWTEAGVNRSKACLLFWMYYMHVLNLLCTDVGYIAELWRSLPAPWISWAKFSVVLVSTFFLVLFTWLGNKDPGDSILQKKKEKKMKKA